MENDPLADQPTGPCTKCEHGWVHVRPAYAEHQVPMPDTDGLDAETVAAVEREVARMRAAAADSYYPCRNCRPAQFFRWVGGHWEKDHDPGGCSECTATMGKRHARAAGRYSERPLST